MSWQVTLPRDPTLRAERQEQLVREHEHYTMIGRERSQQRAQDRARDQYARDMAANRALLSRVPSSDAPRQPVASTSTSRSPQPSSSSSLDAPRNDQDGRRIFVGQLDVHVDEERLIDVFETIGPVVTVDMPFDWDNARSRGYAFVEFERLEDAQTALTWGNTRQIDGRPFQVSAVTPRRRDRDQMPAAQPPRQQPPASRTVYVGSLAWDIDEDRLTAEFARFGEIESVRRPREHATGQYKSYAFIDFVRLDCARAALALNGTELEGRRIYVELSNAQHTAPTTEQSSQRERDHLDQLLRNATRSRAAPQAGLRRLSPAPSDRSSSLASSGSHPAPAQRTGLPCRFFAQGFCRSGRDCRYSHDLPPGVRPSPAALAAGATMPSYSQRAEREREKALETASRMAASAPDSTCMICYENPDAFGLLDCCSHIFCVSCIRAWRDTRTKSQEQIEANVHRTCPVCRATSMLMTPSSRLPTTPAEKTAIIQAERDRMAQIPCRVFESSPPHRRWCPYGRDCFYRHTGRDGRPHIFSWTYEEHLARVRRRREEERDREESDFARDLYARLVDSPSEHSVGDPSHMLAHLLRHRGLPRPIERMLRQALGDSYLYDSQMDDNELPAYLLDTLALTGPPPAHQRATSDEWQTTDSEREVESDLSDMPGLIDINATPRRPAARVEVEEDEEGDMPGLVPVGDVSEEDDEEDYSEHIVDEEEFRYLPSTVPPARLGTDDEVLASANVESSPALDEGDSAGDIFYDVISPRSATFDSYDDDEEPTRQPDSGYHSGEHGVDDNELSEEEEVDSQEGSETSLPPLSNITFIPTAPVTHGRIDESDDEDPTFDDDFEDEVAFETPSRRSEPMPSLERITRPARSPASHDDSSTMPPSEVLNSGRWSRLPPAAVVAHHAGLPAGEQLINGRWCPIQTETLAPEERSTTMSDQLVNGRWTRQAPIATSQSADLPIPFDRPRTVEVWDDVD